MATQGLLRLYLAILSVKDGGKGGISRVAVFISNLMSFKRSFPPDNLVSLQMIDCLQRFILKGTILSYFFSFGGRFGRKKRHIDFYARETRAAKQAK